MSEEKYELGEVAFIYPADRTTLYHRKDGKPGLLTKDGKLAWCPSTHGGAGFPATTKFILEGETYYAICPICREKYEARKDEQGRFRALSLSEWESRKEKVEEK